jgi:hypothetical protein
VPAGTDVLGSGAAQGAITARVTDALNLCGVGALAICAWELSLTRDPNTRRIAIRWWCWAVMALGQYLLLMLHLVMDYFMDPTRSVVQMRPPFYPVHRAYLWTSTIIWAAGVPFVWCSLRAWTMENERSVTPTS